MFKNKNYFKTISSTLALSVFSNKQYTALLPGSDSQA
jgi:hypothetical protein